MKDGCFIFLLAPGRWPCSQCLNISNLTGGRALGMRRLQKVASDIRQDTDTSVGKLTKDDDRGGVWRVVAFGA